MPDKIRSVEDFKKIIASPHLSVIHFSAEWSSHSTQANEILDEMKNKEEVKNAKVQIYYVEAEELDELSKDYNIEVAPTVILFRNGIHITELCGIETEELWNTVKEQIKKTEPKSMPIRDSMKERLDKLINQHKLMVFMKGDKENPRCGFSKQIIDILNKLRFPYGTYDILQDQDVRQQLKIYSNWPTYPQLYFEGQLIGGLDIVKEMLESGELHEMLENKF